MNSGLPYLTGQRWFIACPICHEWATFKDSPREANEALDSHIGHEHHYETEET